jgi:uncharacterized integral membrane protein
METAGFPESVKLALAIITSLCCFIVTVVTYKKSLGDMATKLLTTLKALWQEPLLNPGLLVFAIVLGTFSLFTLPGFMASLATILATHTAGQMLGQLWSVPFATLLTIPFYILVVQSCFDIYERTKKAYSGSEMSVPAGVMLTLALVPGTIIASAFAFFISSALGPDKLNWTGNKTAVNIWLCALGAIPAGLAFTESSYDYFIKPIMNFIYGFGKWAYDSLPSWKDYEYWFKRQESGYEQLP